MSRQRTIAEGHDTGRDFAGAALLPCCTSPLAPLPSSEEAVPGAAADAPLGSARADPRRSPSSPLPAPSPLESAPEPSSLHATVLRLRTALVPVPDCAQHKVRRQPATLMVMTPSISAT